MLRLLPLLLLFASCASTYNHSGLVRTYEARANDGDIDGVMELFTEDARWFVGREIVSAGAEQIEAYHQWQQVLGAQRTIEVVDSQEAAVLCRVEGTNEFLDSIGVGAVWEMVELHLQDGRIAVVNAGPSQPTVNPATANERYERFRNWLKREHPQDWVTFFGSGGFSYGVVPGRRLLELGQTWATLPLPERPAEP